MAARKSPPNNHLQEAMALLISNQAGFVEQIARNDQDRLALQIKSEEWQRKSDERFARIEAWQQKSDERFARIEVQLVQLPAKVVQTVLDQFPRLKKEIGFKSPSEVGSK